MAQVAEILQRDVKMRHWQSVKQMDTELCLLPW